MKDTDTLDLLASEDVDMVLIVLLSATIKLLRLSANNHQEQRDTAKSRADVSQREGDDDSYHYWLNEYLLQDNKLNFINEELQRIKKKYKG